MNSSKKNTFIWEIARCFAWFFGTLGILVLLFVMSVSIPKYRVRENLKKSAEYLLESEELFHQLRQGDRRTEIHNYADATTLNILYSIDGKDRIKEIFLSPMYSDKMNLEKSVTELLVERITFEKPAETMYDRYWHGMILILRPLFLLFTIQHIRWIFLGVLLACMIVLSRMLWKKQQRMSVVVLWLAALLVQLPMVAFCLEYFPTFLIMFLIAIAMVRWEEKRQRILGLCIVSGVCVAFFDFLTTETVAFVIPLALVYCIWEKKSAVKTLKEELLYLINAGVRWGGAYVLTYLVKWGISSLISGQNRFSVALEQLAGRQGNEAVSFAIDSLSNNYISVEAWSNAGGDILPQFLSAVIINVRLLLGLSGKITLEQLALLILFVLGLGSTVIYMFRKPGKTDIVPVILFLLGLMPIIRMMVLHNHSIEHCFFVYRALYGTIFCMGAGVWQLFDWEFLRRRKRR